MLDFDVLLQRDKEGKISTTCISHKKKDSNARLKSTDTCASKVDKNALWYEVLSQQSFALRTPDPDNARRNERLFLWLCAGGELLLESFYPTRVIDHLSLVEEVPHVLSGLEPMTRRNAVAQDESIVLSFHFMESALKRFYASILKYRGFAGDKSHGDNKILELLGREETASILDRSYRTLQNHASNMKHAKNVDKITYDCVVKSAEILLDKMRAVLSTSSSERSKNLLAFKQLAMDYYNMLRFIPTALRPLLWCINLGVNFSPVPFESTCSPLKGGKVLPCPEDRMIWKILEGWSEIPNKLDKQLLIDIPRCKGYQLSRKNEKVLAKILKAWVLSDKQHVYIQGLDSIAACIVSTLPLEPPLLFSIFKTFVDLYLNDLCKENYAIILSLRMRFLWQLLAYHNSILFIHFADIGFSMESGLDENSTRPDFVIPWILTLFAHVFPSQEVLRIWDVLVLTEPSRRGLFIPLFSVSLLVCLKPKLIQNKSLEGNIAIMKKLSVSIPALVSCSLQLLQVAFKLTPISLKLSTGVVPSIKLEMLKEELDRILFVDLRSKEEFILCSVRNSFHVEAKGLLEGANVVDLVHERKQRGKHIILLYYPCDNVLIRDVALSLLAHKVNFICQLTAAMEVIRDFLEDSIEFGAYKLIA